MEDAKKRYGEDMDAMMKALDAAYEDYAKSHGLTYMSLCILEEVRAQPESCTQKTICEATHYPKQSVNLVIKSFLDNGYVELKELPSDRRNKAIRLTAQGRAFTETVLRAMDKADEEAMAVISDRDWQAMLTTMQQYTTAFVARIAKG